LNLLNVLVPVSGFACKENADAIKDRVDKIAQQSPGFAQTSKAVSVLLDQLSRDENRDIPCEKYWRSKA
jgi:hypothetical protein